MTTRGRWQQGDHGGGHAVSLACKPGTRPKDGDPVRVLEESRVFYVNQTCTNARLLKGEDRQRNTFEKAMQLSTERESKGKGAHKKRQPS